MISTAVLQKRSLVVGGMWPWFDFEGCHMGLWSYFKLIN